MNGKMKDQLTKEDLIEIQEILDKNNRPTKDLIAVVDNNIVTIQTSFGQPMYQMHVNEYNDIINWKK